MEEILNNEYYASLLMLVSQIVFLYFRTLNVIYTAEKKILPAIVTGNCIGIAWLISMSIGANSVLKGEALPIIAFLVGGSLGTYLGISKKKREDELRG